MSDTLIKRSWTVIMTHLSAAPDPNSYGRACGASIRAYICLWVSITALIPGGIWHVFQCGAIKTPGEAASGRTTCRKICRDGRPGRGRRIRWTLARSLVPPVTKGADLFQYDVRKMPEIQRTPAKQETLARRPAAKDWRRQLGKFEKKKKHRPPSWL